MEPNVPLVFAVMVPALELVNHHQKANVLIFLTPIGMPRELTLVKIS